MSLKSSSVKIYTLGCKLNQYESSILAERFRAAGFEVVTREKEADWVVINTCTVTSRADAKSRKLLHRARKSGSKVAVIGCYPEVANHDFFFQEGADLVLGNRDKYQVVEYITTGNGNSKVSNEELEEESCFPELGLIGVTERTRAFVKIQEGCDYFCSFCIVPYARGMPVSRSPEAVIEEIKRLTEKGYQEIVLTGVNIGEYNYRERGDYYLADLLEKILGLNEVYRLRLSSLEVNRLDERILVLFNRYNSLARHLHIPLQSGSDYILELMNRRYTTEQYQRTVLSFKEAFPELCLGADVIVGFPGETEEDFQKTVKFLEETPIDYLHVFQYSPRRGTKAYNLPGSVPVMVTRKRSAFLQELSKLKRERFYQSMLGSLQEVIVEGKQRDGNYQGHTSNYLKVYLIGEEKHLYKNSRVRVILRRLFRDGVLGEVVSG